MAVVEFKQGNYLVSTDRRKLDIPLIHGYLSLGAYWASGRTLATVRRSIRNSLCFGLFEGGRQVGFARVVTDYATFAWLCDVFVLESHRSRGLGKWLIRCVVQHPALATIRLMLLATRDAHGLYERYGGFVRLQEPERWMIRRTPAQ